MVEFMTGYSSPMDRQFDEQPIDTLEPKRKIEDPIVPISELGTTTFDGLQGGILKSVENSIRMGAKKIQLVIGGNPQGMSSMFASHGKDVRQELRERAKAAGVEITGVELMPQKVSNMSGLGQQGFSEEMRRENLQHVKDAIKFAAEVAGGGGVDIWSQEFQRDILYASWNKDKKFFGTSPEELDDPRKAKITKYLVDSRTGEPIRGSGIATNRTVNRVKYYTAKEVGLAGQINPETGKVFDDNDPIAPKEKNDQSGTFETEPVDWNRIVEEAEKKKISPERHAYDQQVEAQLRQMRGQRKLFQAEANQMFQQYEESGEMLKILPQEIEKEKDEAKRMKMIREYQHIKDRMPLIKSQYDARREQAASAFEQEEELEKSKEFIKDPTQYGQERTWGSYAEAGIAAMEESKRLKAEAEKSGRKVKDIYVGPELGHAGQMYGGHPEEFIEIVEKSREEMAKSLAAKGWEKDAAKEAAKKHIKGMLDTSHLSMWYKHFAPEKGESEDERLKRFNKWMKDETKEMVKRGVVGGIQVVDSATSGHAHLPAGQGMFDMVGIVKEMRKEGFSGPIVSEGHEEDGLNAGRTLTATWEAFGSPTNTITPGPGGPRTWGGVQNSYFGRATGGPNYIVGAYAPSNDWQLWSETPFE